MSETKALTKKQIEKLKLKLIEEKNNILDNFSSNTEELGLTVGSSGLDEVEQSINDYNSSHLLRFKNRDLFYLKKIDKSLKKIELDEYGLCCDCGGWIKFERLLARPTAEMCIMCKEDSERDESSSFTGRQSKSLGKVVDLERQFVG